MSLKKVLLKPALFFRRAYWWMFRPKTNGVRAVVVNPKGEVLLVKHAYGEGWFLPGGKVGRGETFEAALRRELDEEVGIKQLVIDKPLGTYVNRFEYKTDTITVFVVKEFQQTAKLGFELDKVKWLGPEEAIRQGSPGTKRRIREYLGQEAIGTSW